MMKTYERVRNTLKTVAKRRKRTYDFKIKQTEFATGQRVWYYYPRRYVKRSQKFQFFCVCPYVVVKRVGPVNYFIRKNDKTPGFVVHVDKLKLCKEVDDLKGGRAPPSGINCIARVATCKLVVTESVSEMENTEEKQKEVRPGPVKKN